MKEFTDYFDVILEHEGGFVNHPNDPGGQTKYGISFRFLQDLKIDDGDIDGDGDIDTDDIKALTVEDSKGLYKKFFWNPLHLDGIENEELKLHVFDMAVNAGNKTAVKLLQRILGLDDDGIIGNQTVTACNSSEDNLVSMYKKARERYYLNIISNNPKLAVFKNGWLNRIATTKFKA